MRPGKKKDGIETENRPEVEIHSLVQAIREGSDEFEKATPEHEKRRQAIKDRIRAELGFNE